MSDVDLLAVSGVGALVALTAAQGEAALRIPSIVSSQSGFSEGRSIL